MESTTSELIAGLWAALLKKKMIAKEIILKI
jgi:hypothetical protein